MSRRIEALRTFKTRFKRLSKKFKTLSLEIAELGKSIANEPKQGTSLGSGFYKIRLASKSKGAGKRGGFRVVTYYIEQKEDTETIYLVTI